MGAGRAVFGPYWLYESCRCSGCLKGEQGIFHLFLLPFKQSLPLPLCKCHIVCAIIFACGIGGNKAFRKHEVFEDVRVVLWPRGQAYQPYNGFDLQ